METISSDINRDFQENLEKIRESKDKVLKLVVDYYKAIEDDFKFKVQMNVLNKRVEDIDNNI